MATDLSQFTVPNDRFDVAQDNAAKLDAVVNGPNAVVTTRTGKGIQSLDKIIASIAAVTDRGPWTTATSYQVKDLVTDTGVFYIAVTAHTSGATFAGDIANWRVYQGVTQNQLDTQLVAQGVLNDSRYGPLFATVAAMVAAGPVAVDGNIVAVVAGMTLQTQGLGAAGGSGAGEYFVVAGDSSNGTDRLLLANGTTAVLQHLNGVVDVAHYGPAGDGAADDDAKIQAAIAASSSVGAIRFTPGKTYLIDQADFTGINDLTIFANGATFKISNNLSGSSVGVKFSACNRIVFDVLKVINSGGFEVGRSRLVHFISCNDISGGKVEIEYDAQHLPEDDNPGSPLWQLADNDRSIVIQSSNRITIGTLSAKKADIAIRLLDNNGVNINHISIDTYMKGLKIDGGINLKLKGGLIENQTPTFESYLRSAFNDWRKDRPGNNGILLATEGATTHPSPTDILIKNFNVKDPGEHGVRLSGDVDRRRIRLSKITTKNTGGMGIKVLGSDTTFLREFQFDNLLMIDCLVDEQETLAAADGATQFVYSDIANTINISGIEWPENFGGDVTSITISGSASNNGVFTISSRDSDTQITLGSALVNETDSTPNSVFTWENEFKVSHGLGLYNVRDGMVSNVLVTNQSQTDSCEDGVQFHDAISIKLANIAVKNAKANGISFRPNNGGTFNDIQAIHLNGYYLNSCATGLRWDHEQITLNELNFEGGRIQNCATSINVSNSGGTPGTVANDCRIQAHLENSTTYYTADVTGVLLDLSGNTDGTKDTSARDGSMWQVEGDTLHVLKSGVWTAL